MKYAGDTTLSEYIYKIYDTLDKTKQALFFIRLSNIIRGLCILNTNKNFQFDKIDLFIIDGPPVNSSRNARYPAIPLLFDKIKKGSIILLDVIP